MTVGTHSTNLLQASIVALKTYLYSEAKYYTIII